MSLDLIPQSGIAFIGGELDRAAHLRRDRHALQAALAAGGRVMAMWRGKPLLSANGDARAIAWLDATHPVLAGLDPAEFLFLGRFGETFCFAADLSEFWSPDTVDETSLSQFSDPSIQIHPAGPLGSGFYELRGAMLLLSAAEAEVAGTARALFTWHRDHQFCARCGAPTVAAEAGWLRHCPSCGRRHFPRTDPVAIVLVTDGPRLLLGRSPGWPDGMYSLLAGFVEPGETLEAAAIREVHEESGITITDVRYVACQPWPFPGSLMVGMQAKATNTEITLDPEELEDAIWVTKQDLIEASLGANPSLKPARRGAIARAMIDQWMAGHLTD